MAIYAARSIRGDVQTHGRIVRRRKRSSFQVATLDRLAEISSPPDINELSAATPEVLVAALGDAALRVHAESEIHERLMLSLIHI